MKTVVTGSGGQLGSELCRQLGGQAVGLDLPEFDLTDRQGVLRRIETLRPDVVINTAAYTRVDEAEERPELAQAVNAEGVAHLVEACRAIDCLLVQISTDYIFGGEAGRSIPYRETDPTSPVNVYGNTKLAGERHAAAWVKHLIVRTSGLYGRLGERSSGNFVETILRVARTGRRLEVVDDQHCTPSYVPHVARAIRFLIETSARGRYHVVDAGETTWYGFTAEILRQSGQSAHVTAISTAHRGGAPRPRFSVLDTARYHALPGVPPAVTWQASLAEYLGRVRPDAP
jgi:dTDP-4-dehydrorhamnose reductase